MQSILRTKFKLLFFFIVSFQLGCSSHDHKRSLNPEEIPIPTVMLSSGSDPPIHAQFAHHSDRTSDCDILENDLLSHRRRYPNFEGLRPSDLEEEEILSPKESIAFDLSDGVEDGNPRVYFTDTSADCRAKAIQEGWIIVNRNHFYIPDVCRRFILLHEAGHLAHWRSGSSMDPEEFADQWAESVMNASHLRRICQ